MKKRSRAATPQNLSRREVLRIAGVAALNASPLAHAAQIATENIAWLAINQAGSGPFKVVPPVRVVRSWDLLVLDLDWRNLEYVPAGAGRLPHLRRVTRGAPAYLILKFPPQHIGEVASASPTGRASHEPSGASRLVFRVSDQVDEFEYRLPVILEACQRFAMNVNCRAPHPPRCQSPVAPPAPEETAIEAPFGLILSPTGEQTWTHANNPVSSGDRVELWHTRLTPPVQPVPTGVVGLRALYNTPSRGISNSLIPNDNQRYQIAELSSDPLLSRFRFPQVISVNRLMLSALGAWLDVSFDYDPPFPQTQLSVSGWRHQAVMGRDQFVQVTEEGILIPFGHRAALVTTQERRFADSGNGALVAYLHTEQVIVLREPERTYFTGPGTQTQQEREAPFRSVRVLTEATPVIDNPTGTDPFLVKVGGQNFPFRLSAVDRDGQVVNFAAPLVFATRTRRFDGFQFYSGRSDDVVPKEFALNGQKLSLVPASAQSDPALETDRIRLGVLIDPDQESCHPTFTAAWVRIPAVKQLLGNNATTEVIHPDVYRLDGFGGRNTQAQLYLQFVQSLPMAGGGIGGGLAQMQVALSGLSRSVGAVSSPPNQPVNLNQFINNTFDPKDFFPNARLLGAFPLSDIASAVTNFSAGDAGGKVPKLVVQPIPGPNGAPVAIEATFQWRTTQLRALPIFSPRLGGTPAELFILSRLRKELTGNPTTTQVIQGELSNFEIRLVGSSPYITIQFRSLKFRSQNGERPVVVPNIAGVQFGGPLKFVEQLAKLLGQSGEGLSLDLVRNGIRAGYTQALPSLGFGVFRLENISLSVGLYLPLGGDEPLSYSFAFGQRFNPFHVAVYIFTGGGYFELEMSPRGLLRLEASVEFGASLGLDLGVASGKVEVMAGIRYVMLTSADPAARSVQLEGYLRASGSLEVLAILRVSVTLYLGLTYDIARGDVWGRATVTVEVELLFFSKSVSFSYEQRFAGSGPPPSAGAGAFRRLGKSSVQSVLQAPQAGLPPFEQYVSRDEWRSYCAAFAA